MRFGGIGKRASRQDSNTQATEMLCGQVGTSGTVIKTTDGGERWRKCAVLDAATDSSAQEHPEHLPGGVFRRGLAQDNLWRMYVANDLVKGQFR
jgi:hypothetical protein